MFGPIGQKDGQHMADAIQPTRRTATGTVKIAAGQVVMGICGLAIHIYLARALEPKLYGDLAVVTSVIMWWQLLGFSLLGTATVHFVAAAGDKWREVAASAVRAQILWCSVLLALYTASAPAVAALLGDPALTTYLWVFGIDLLIYGLYEIHRRVLLGRREYGRAAFTWMCYWVTKLVLVWGLLAGGLSVKGAIIASIGASASGLFLTWRWTAPGLRRAGSSARPLIMFGLPLAGLVLIGRLTQSMDLWCVKALLASDQAPGHYGAAQYVYQAAFGLAAAVVGATFPALTQAVSRRDKPVCRELIQQSFRFVFVTMLGALALVACGAEEVVTLIFSASYAAAATPATILMAVAFMSGVHAVGVSGLIAAGKPGLCLAALAPLVPLNIGLNLVLVPQYGLTGAALATASTALLGSAIIVVLVWREFHVGLPLLPLARISLVALAVYFLGRSITATGPVTVARLLGLLAAYLLLLFLTGELTRRDLQPLMFWRA